MYVFLYVMSLPNSYILSQCILGVLNSLICFRHKYTTYELRKMKQSQIILLFENKDFIFFILGCFFF